MISRTFIYLILTGKASANDSQIFEDDADSSIPTSFDSTIEANKDDIAVTHYDQVEFPSKIIVGTMDGSITCLESSTGSVIWTFDTGGELIDSSVPQIIPSLFGNLYLFKGGKLDKHPLSIYDIVSKSPFSMKDELLYMGNKEDQVFVLDSSGRQHSCKEGIKSCTRSITHPLIVTRTNFQVRVLDKRSAMEKWNASVSEFSSTSSYHFYDSTIVHDKKDANFDTGGNNIIQHRRNFAFSSNTFSSSFFSPSHGLLSDMDGKMTLIDIRNGKTVWTTYLPSPAVYLHKPGNNAQRQNFWIGDLKFVPQLMLHLDETEINQSQMRIFIGEYNSKYIAFEQLAQYSNAMSHIQNPSFEDSEQHRFSTPHLRNNNPIIDEEESKDEKVINTKLWKQTNGIVFPDNQDSFPVLTPSPNSASHSINLEDLINNSNNSEHIKTDEEQTDQISSNPSSSSDLTVPNVNSGKQKIYQRRTCTGPNDMSLECILGIHYIQIDPNCIGDDCICDSTPRLPTRNLPKLPERPSNPYLPLHPNFDWEDGNYDSILYAIILFDFYLTQFKSIPFVFQLALPALILIALIIGILLRRTRDIRHHPMDQNDFKQRSSNESSNNNSSQSTTSTASSNISTGSILPQKFNLPDENGILTVGKIQVNLTKPLGHGSSGTIVFEGKMDGRRIAVKRMLKTFFSVAQQETSVLTHSDEHPNVIRYYTTEEDHDFIYLALSYADCTLSSYIEDNQNYEALGNEGKANILKQLALGIAHLHDINVVHRDIKPQNALITAANIIKISDMGLAKRLEGEIHSFSTAAQGTVGWQAPELIVFKSDSKNGNNSSSTSSSGSNSSGSDFNSSFKRVKISKKVDIFSLGCLFYYTLTRDHPFGDRLIRESNIINGNHQMDPKIISFEAFDLISKMIQLDPKQRPSARQVLDHPYFWDAGKRLRFIKDASDFLEFEKPQSELVLRFEEAAAQAHVIPGMDWISTLPNELMQDLNKFRKYNCSKLRDLLRVIRNKAHHYRDLPPDAQATFGALPEGFLDYFCLHRFPYLLTFTYEYARVNYSDDKVFQEYFQSQPAKEKPVTSSSSSSSFNTNPNRTLSPPPYRPNDTPSNIQVTDHSDVELPPGLNVDSRFIASPQKPNTSISPSRNPNNRNSNNNNNNDHYNNHNSSRQHHHYSNNNGKSRNNSSNIPPTNPNYKSNGDWRTNKK